MSTRTKVTKTQTRKHTKARFQVGNKTTKTKLTNLLRGQERKKRKNRYAKLEVDEDLSTLRLTARGKEE